MEMMLKVTVKEQKVFQAEGTVQENPRAYLQNGTCEALVQGISLEP